jgi:hypothetical protein
MRAPAERAKVVKLTIVPSAARSSPASPLSVAYLLGDPAARSNTGDFSWIRTQPGGTYCPPLSWRCRTLTGAPSEPGLYYTLVRWWPGYMSAPHAYTSDRFCMVLSGTWWCNSGNDFDPAACVSAPAGSFVRRVAGTPHYDGVIRSHNEPAIIAICGIGPVNYKLVDPSKPGWRAV